MQDINAHSSHPRHRSHLYLLMAVHVKLFPPRFPKDVCFFWSRVTFTKRLFNSVIQTCFLLFLLRQKPQKLLEIKVSVNEVSGSYYPISRCVEMLINTQTRVQLSWQITYRQIIHLGVVVTDIRVLMGAGNLWNCLDFKVKRLKLLEIVMELLS